MNFVWLLFHQDGEGICNCSATNCACGHRGSM